jgi:hypothetical protein
MTQTPGNLNLLSQPEPAHPKAEGLPEQNRQWPKEKFHEAPAVHSPEQIFCVEMTNLLWKPWSYFSVLV